MVEAPGRHAPVLVTPLEGPEQRRLAERLGDRGWRVLEPCAIADLAAAQAPLRILLAGVEDPAVEPALRAAGHAVNVLDDGFRADPGYGRTDRRGAASLLEQAAAMVPDLVLCEVDRRYAAAVRGHVPGLVAHLVPDSAHESRTTRDETIAQARSVRTEVLVEAQQCDPSNIEEQLAAVIKRLATEFAKLREAERTDNPWLNVVGTGRAMPGDPELIVARASGDDAPYLLDALYLMHCRGEKLPGCWFGSVRCGDTPRQRCAHALEALILVEDGQADPARIEYSGPGERADLLVALIDRLRGEGGPKARMHYHVWGDSHVCQCRINARPADKPHLRELAGLLANAVLEGNRPVQKWKTRCIQVLRLDKPGRLRLQPRGEGSPLTPLPADADDRAFLHDYLRDRVAPDETRQSDGITDGLLPEDFVLRSFVLADGIKRSFTITETRFIDGVRCEDGPETSEIALEEALLHVGPRGLLLAEWQVGGETRRNWPLKNPTCEPTPFFDVLLQHHPGRMKATQPNDAPAPTVAHVLEVTNRLRRVYSAYDSKTEEAVVELKPDDRSTTLGKGLPADPAKTDPTKPKGWFAALLDALLAGVRRVDAGACNQKLTSEHLRHVFDDRAYVVSSVITMGAGPETPAARTAEDHLLLRQALVDAYAPRPAYNVEFAARELAAAAYDRFAAAAGAGAEQNRYAVTERALVHWGQGRFAAEHASHHATGPYSRLFLAEIVNNAVFHSLSRALAECYEARRAIDARWEASPRGLADAQVRDADRRAVAEDVRRIRAFTVAYTNVVLFTDVSTQLQGRELCHLIETQLPAREHYRELMDQLARAEALEADDRAQAATTRRRYAATVTGFFAAWLTFGTLLMRFETLQAQLGWVVAAAGGFTLLFVMMIEGVRFSEAGSILLRAVQSLILPWSLLREQFWQKKPRR